MSDPQPEPAPAPDNVVPPSEDRPCRACGKLLRFVSVWNGAKWSTLPLDTVAPTYDLGTDGAYRRSTALVSHFATCPKASTFSRSKPKASTQAPPGVETVVLGPDDRMPFGSHQGTAMRDLPTHYLRWVHDNLPPSSPKNRAVLAYIEEHGCNEGDA